MADLLNEVEKVAPPENKMDDDEWKERYPDVYGSSEPPPANDSVSAVSLEGTLTVVREKVWSFGDAALKSVAEVLVGFGISPTILGYSEEELLEGEETAEAARLRIQKDEVLSKSSFAMRSEENINRRRADETLQQPDGEDDEDAFARQEDIRAVSWRGSADDLAGEAGEDKKDK